MKRTKFLTSTVGFLFSSIALASTTVLPALANNSLNNQDSQINSLENPTHLSEVEEEVCNAKVNYSLYTNNIQSQVFENNNFPGIVKPVSMTYSNTKTTIVGLLNTEVQYILSETIELSKDDNKQGQDSSTASDYFRRRGVDWCCPCPGHPKPCCWC